jgi:signal transduction histidine kinase/HAMP domain-containing protein
VKASRVAVTEGLIAEGGRNNMKRVSFSSLRVRLLFLVLVGTIPALGLMLWNAAEQRRAAALEAEASALRLAQIVSINQERVIEVARELLSAVAQFPQVRQRDSQGCSALFANLLKQYRGYANLVAAEPNGNVFCSGQPMSGTVNFADRKWFHRVVESRALATSEYSIGRITGRPIVVLGYPAINASGQLEAVLSIALDLAWLNELAAKTRLPSTTTLTVIDRKGTVLVRFPDSEKWVGKSMPQTRLLQTILSRGEGTAEAFGIDGIARLYGFSRLGSGGEAYVTVGIAKDVAFFTANFILVRNLTALGVATLLAILAAWFGSDLFVLRRINALSAASKRLAAGDLSARAGPMHGQDEFSQLAYTFDEMAGSIERFVSERRQSAKTLRAGYEKLQTLKEINQSILSSLDLKAIIEGILEKTVTLSLFDIGVIRLIDSRGEFLEPVASRGYRDPENVHGKPTDPGDLRTGKVLVQVITEKQVYPIEDLSTVNAMQAFKREGVQSAVVVPVRIENQVLGTIQLGSRTGRKFSTDEIDFLEALGIQMGIAVQNARLFSGTKQNLERIRTLSEINLAITSTLDLHVVLNVLMEKIDLFLPDTAVLVWLLNRESGLLEQAACWNLPEEEWKGRKLKGTPSLVKEAIEGKAPVVVANVQTDPRTMDPDFYRRHGLISYLGIPMLGKGEVLGVLVFLTREAHKFTSEEVEFLTTLAGQAAIAIHNSQLYEQTKSQAIELKKANMDLKRHGEIQELLKEISQDITSLDLDTLLKKLTEKVREVLKVDVADVRVRTNEMLHIMGVAGIDSRLLESTSTTSRGRSQWIIKNRRPLIISDIEQKKDLLTGSVLLGLGLRGYLGVGLFSRGGEVIGILRALSYQPRNFTQQEVDLLQQLANGVAIALENVRLLEQTKRQAAELEQASKMQADFTAMIIHDLRSPIMSMMGTAEVMAEGVFGPVNEEQKKWLLKLLASGHSLVDLVSDYLDLSKVEAGRIEITKEEVDLRELIQNSIENYSPLTRDRKVSMTHAVHPGLCRIKADPRRLNQVLSNLLSNAVKFTADGGQIEVGAEDVNGTQIKVWVRDNGIGIAPEEIGGLFEKYRQLTSGKISEHKGTGLGLVICKTIVETHGGKIWVQSEEGKSTTFFFTLPVNA